jgi:hypothetical protein
MLLRLAELAEKQSGDNFAGMLRAVTTCSVDDVDGLSLQEQHISAR